MSDEIATFMLNAGVILALMLTVRALGIALRDAGIADILCGLGVAAVAPVTWVANPGYDDYVARTIGLIPLPPKRKH
jgi:hypothetical protein